MDVKREDLEVKLKPLNVSESSKEAKELHEFLKARVVGQERALILFSRIYEVALSGISGGLPTSALLLGPSGVGKTLTAEVIADYFGFNPIKISGTEFVERHTIAKLLGSPPGYVGYDEPSMLLAAESDINSRKLPKGAKALIKKFNESIDSSNEDIKELEELREKALLSLQQAEQLRQKLVELRTKEKEKTAVSINDSVAVSLDSDLQKVDDYIDNLRGEIVEVDSMLGDSKKEKEAKLKSMKELLESHNIPIVVDSDGKIKVASLKKGISGIILFDEFDKANSSVQKLFYEILDKGRVTLSNGKEVGFDRFLIIFTANYGSREIAEMLQHRSMLFKPQQEKSEMKIDQDIYETAIAALKERIDAPLLGRIKHIVVCRPLREEHYHEIFDITMREKIASLVNTFPICIWIYKEARDFIVKRAFKYRDIGARRLRMLIETEIIFRIAIFKNTNLINAGNIIVVGLNDKSGNKPDLEFFVYGQDEKSESNEPLVETYKILE